MEVAVRGAGQHVAEQGWDSAQTAYERARCAELRWGEVCAQLEAIEAGPRLDEALAQAQRMCAWMPDSVRRAPARWWRRVVAGEREVRLQVARSLRVVGEQIGDAGVAALVGCPDLARLTILRLDGVGAGVEVGDVIAETAQLGELVELYLHNDALGDEGASGVAWRALRMPRLEVLSLVGQRVGDVGAMALAELEGLRALYVDDNAIRNAGLIALAHARGLRTLERLSLYRNGGVGDEGLRSLVRRLDEHFPELLDVDVSGCGVSLALQDELEMRLRKRWRSA
jgi:hypothetical protein